MHFILWGEHADVVIFLPSKKKKIEELWSDARSLRAWKFNLCVKCLIYRGPQSLVFFVVCL